MAAFYLSSTFEDLKDCRREVIKMLRRRGHDVISMEDYGPSGRPPLAQCLADVAKCDIYVGIVAWRYGFVPSEDNPDRRSITESEYRHARTLEKECWIFLIAPDAPWPANLMDTGEQEERVKAFRAELSASHVVCFFKDCRDLVRKLREAVAKRFSYARAWWVWLIGFLPSWPWYVTATAALCVALLTATLAIGGYYWRLSPQERAEFLIRYGVWDSPVTVPLNDYFALPPGNPDVEQCVPPNTNLWSYTRGQWCLTGDEELLVRGPDWGLRGVPNGTTLYDFKATFLIDFKQGDEAAWVARAREGGRGGYVFKLQRQRVEGDVFRLFLNGWAYTPDGREVPLGQTPNNPLTIGDIYEEDHFIVTLTARGNVFSHVLVLQNTEGAGTDRPAFGQDFEVYDFTDSDSRCPYAGLGLLPYGRIGFFAPKGGEILIDDFELSPL